MMLLAKQLYVACQFVNCMHLAGIKVSPDDIINYVLENVK